MADTPNIFQSIRSALATADPLSIINHLLPKKVTEAKSRARRLPLDREFTDNYSPQVVDIARTIAKRANREHGFQLTEDRRIVENHGITGPESESTRLPSHPFSQTSQFT